MIKFRDVNGNDVMKMNDKGELEFEDKDKQEEFLKIEEKVNKNNGTNDNK